MMSNEQKLIAAISSLNSMRGIMLEIKDNYSSILKGNRVLNDEHLRLSNKIDAAIERLKHPYLSLATIGTTSAGKSTVVNALAGRKIAPMEAKETSAGVLKLVPNESRNLFIEKSDYWEFGNFPNISDEDAYNKIASIFERYFKIKNLVPAPLITVEGPLLWSKHPELIGLPESLSFQFVDLPGLKTVDDPKNLPIIKENLAKSVSIVAMDYTDVDQVKIIRLLEELKEIVEALDGNDGSILFILNKVDRRTSSDEPLREKIKTLKNAIISTLPLNKGVEVDIIPFCANMLYLAQSAIGNAFYTDNEFSIDFKQIGNLILEYGIRFEKSSVEEERNAYERVSKCYEIIRDEYDEPIGTKMKNEPSKDDVVTIVKAAYRMSHAERLFEALKNKIETSFSSVVIYPAVNDLFTAINDFTAKLNTFIGLKKTKNQVGLIMKKVNLLKNKLSIIGCSDELPSEDKNNSSRTSISFRTQIEAIESKLASIPNGEISPAQRLIIQEELDEISQKIETGDFEGEIDKKLKEIKEKTSSISTHILHIIAKGGNFTSQVANYLAEASKSNNAVTVYNDLIRVPSDVKDALEAQVIMKLYQALDKLDGKGALEENLRKALPAKLVKPILSPYESIIEVFKKWVTAGYKGSGVYFNIKTNQKLDDKDLVEIQEKIYDPFNRRVRDLLSKKSNVMFGTRSGHFIKGLRQYLKKETSSILSTIDFVAEDKDFNSSMKIYIQSAFDDVDNNEIALPQKLFEFTTPKYIASHTVDVDFVADGLESYTVEGCCSTETKYRTKWKRIENDVYSYDGFHNAKGLYEQWHKGVTASETEFWNILSKWIDESVGMYMKMFSSISLKSVDEIDVMINNRIEEMQDNISTSEEYLKELSTLITKLNEGKKELKFD